MRLIISAIFCMLLITPIPLMAANPNFYQSFVAGDDDGSTDIKPQKDPGPPPDPEDEGGGGSDGGAGGGVTYQGIGTRAYYMACTVSYFHNGTGSCNVIDNHTGTKKYCSPAFTSLYCWPGTCTATGSCPSGC